MRYSRIAVSALSALIWASAPTMLIGGADPGQWQLLTFISVGLMSASILLAPMIPAALAFLSITAAGIIVPLLSLEPSTLFEQVTLVVVYVMTTMTVILTQACDFRRRVVSELALMEKTDIIGLLLHDFEENANDFLWEIDADHRLHRVSDRLAQILGCPVDTLHGVTLTGLLDGTDIGRSAALEFEAYLLERRPFRELQVSLQFGGNAYWLSLTGKPTIDADGVFRGYRGVGSDLTVLRRSDERIAYLACHDSLTALPNRAKFNEVLASMCQEARPFTLHCLDLDGFKGINDMLGHGMGDALLIAVAGRLRNCLREGDLVARLGGDEFAILQAGDDPGAATLLAQRVIAQVAEPYQLGNTTVLVGISVGIVLCQETTCVPEDVMRCSDLALYHSKAQGKGIWSFFSAGMAHRAQERHALQADLRRAIEENELFLEYQPIVDFKTGQITSAEALVRWQHPLRGRITPAEFIPAAEESGLIVDLGAWVLRHACREARTWARDIRVAVNLSPIQFRDPGFLGLVDTILLETDFPAHRLELEITESVFLAKADETLVCLNRLRDRGIHIALDDFGTGYSSLSYLRSFPFDRVKIDQSFIQDLDVHHDAITIVQAIVGMAGGLGICTTGEGVETTSQARLLEATGCSSVQGYLFGRPCSPHRMSALVEDAVAAE